MSELNKDIPFKAVMFADMANGGYIQEYRNDEHGITVSIVAETRNSAPVRTFSALSLPGEVFETFEDLVAQLQKNE